MIVSVSGLGWSGSSAVYDLLKEYEDLKIALSKSRDSEFRLLYDTDGIRDLEYCLTEKSTRIFSYVAIKRFLELVVIYEDYFKFENDFGGNFLKLSQEYIDNLTDFQFKGSTYYELFHIDNRVEKHNRRIIKWLGNRYIRKVFGNIYKDYLIDITSQIRVSYNTENFLDKTRFYLKRLFSALDNSNLPLVFDQLIPPDNPDQYLKYLDSVKCIFVRRDPRDTYLFVKQAKDNSISVPCNSVSNFVIFYKKIIQNTLKQGSPNILNIRFEDLIYNYEETLQQIENFLGVSRHTFKGDYFKPEVSMANTQLFHRFPEYADDIRIIERELVDSLYDFEKYPSPKLVSNKIF